MSTITKLLLAVIKMPSKIGDRIIRLLEIVSKLSNNTYFPTGWAAGSLTQAQFTSHVNAYEIAETNVKGRSYRRTQRGIHHPKSRFVTDIGYGAKQG